MTDKKVVSLQKSPQHASSKALDSREDDPPANRPAQQEASSGGSEQTAHAVKTALTAEIQSEGNLLHAMAAAGNRSKGEESAAKVAETTETTTAVEAKGPSRDDQLGKRQPGRQRKFKGIAGPRGGIPSRHLDDKEFRLEGMVAPSYKPSPTNYPLSDDGPPRPRNSFTQVAFDSRAVDGGEVTDFKYQLQGLLNQVLKDLGLVSGTVIVSGSRKFDQATLSSNVDFIIDLLSLEQTQSNSSKTEKAGEDSEHLVLERLFSAVVKSKYPCQDPSYDLTSRRPRIVFKWKRDGQDYKEVTVRVASSDDTQTAELYNGWTAKHPAHDDLVVLVKHLAKRRGLTKKALNVDAIPVMVAAFLDRKIWRAESVGNYDKTSLGQLLKNFLHYYGTFDSAEEAVGAGGVLVSRSEINFEEQADQDKIRVQGYLEGQSRVDLMQKKPATKQLKKAFKELADKLEAHLKYQYNPKDEHITKLQRLISNEGD